MNYQNSKIYKLVNTVDNEIYIGSTCSTLAKRKGGHKSKARRNPNRRVYQHLNRVGWNNISIILIESVSAFNKDQLRLREQYYIDLLNPSLNSDSAYVNCPHGREHNKCIPCGGSQICEHGRQKSQCKICGGVSICEHGRQHSTCIPCGGVSTCSHGRRKYSCKDCNGNKYSCDYCEVIFSGKAELKTHQTTMKHKKKYIQCFQDCFGEILTMVEAESMNFL